MRRERLGDVEVLDGVRRGEKVKETNEEVEFIGARESGAELACGRGEGKGGVEEGREGGHNGRLFTRAPCERAGGRLVADLGYLIVSVALLWRRRVSVGIYMRGSKAVTLKVLRPHMKKAYLYVKQA